MRFALMLFKSVLLAYAVVVFALCAGIHVAAVCGIDPSGLVPLTTLVVMAVVLFVCAMFGQSYLAKPVPYSAESVINPEKLHGVPRWMETATRFLMYYVVFNFIWFIVRHGSLGGSPEIMDGHKFLVMGHGHPNRPLSDADYAWMHCVVIRGISGHLLVFTWFPVLIALAAMRGVRAFSEPEPKSVDGGT